MEIGLFGGFGEKGRTSIGARTAKTALLMDIGVKVGADGDDYHPLLVWPAAQIDALLVTHAHEDHVGALAWFLGRGFRGPIYMTAETLAEAPATLEAYARAGDLAAHPLPRERVVLFEPGETFAIGDLSVATGRSGHVVGGVWFAVDNGRRRVVHCGDVVPDSGVFVMDPIPQCDLVALDASYGADPVSGAERAAAIARWVATHPGGCLLPTPLSGRSLELLAILPGEVAIHAGMRPALQAQIAAGGAISPAAAALLATRLAAAHDWNDAEPLPAMPLLADDGMGKAGPSSRALPRAVAAGHPVLLSGHLPAGSPGQRAHEDGKADWIRMPTHPTLQGNVAIWQGAGRPQALGHSCPAADLVALQAAIPTLRADCRSGQTLKL